MVHSLLRVAVVGPESCGKTTLITELAAQLQRCGVPALAVDEYARSYYATRAYLPQPSDVLAIAQGQLATERAAERQQPMVLLCDSTVLTCIVWAEVAFGAVSSALQQLNRPQDYALTLLACPDIPWVADPLRSHESGREDLLVRYQTALRYAAVDWVEICGTGEQRCRLAWQALQSKIPQLPKF